jgi:hypothetical protein
MELHLQTGIDVILHSREICRILVVDGIHIQVQLYQLAVESPLLDDRIPNPPDLLSGMCELLWTSTRIAIERSDVNRYAFVFSVQDIMEENLLSFGGVTDLYFVRVHGFPSLDPNSILFNGTCYTHGNSNHQRICR